MSGIATIVSEFRAPHGTVPRIRINLAPPLHGSASKAIPATFKPFPPGTVRGPFTCGKGNDPTGGVEFIVQTRRGWVPFVGARNEEAIARRAAEGFAVNRVGT